MRRQAWGLVLLVAMVSACGGGGGGGGGSTPTAPSPGGGDGGSTATTTITIGSDGRVSPANITVPVGSRVTMVNNHSRPHDMSSDPHPSHEDCPELNQIGFLSPGQSRTSGNLNTARRCGFHDHNEPTNTALSGSITIQ